MTTHEKRDLDEDLERALGRDPDLGWDEHPGCRPDWPYQEDVIAARLHDAMLAELDEEPS